MKRRFLYFLLFIFHFSFLLAQQTDAFVPPTDLTTSLLICQPGRTFYSGFGHCALRLQCPSRGLDVTFTYALDDNLANRIAMFRGNGAGRYSSVKTEAFLEEYVRDGRGVVDYPINISVEQTRALWQILDGENASPRYRQYNFLHTNCSSMCFYALERVMKGEQIVWNGLTDGCTGTYRNFVWHVSAGRPWTGLFWSTILGSTGEQKGQLEDKLAPMLIEPVITQATIQSKTDKTQASTRPFIEGEPTRLVDHTLTYPHNPITPTVVFGLILAIAVVVSLLKLKRSTSRQVNKSTSLRVEGAKKIRNEVPTSRMGLFDALLLAFQSLVGLFIFYLSCLSHMVGAAHNWNLLLFNPLPLLLWLCFRHRKWYPKVYPLYAAVILLYIVSWAWQPTVTLPLVLFALALLVRIATKIYKVKKNS